MGAARLGAAANKGRHGIVRRYPIGPVAGISPFNFPLNLAAHKVAPAIAAGCSIVLKPPSKDPLVMLRIAGYLDETDLPAGAVSILPMDRPTGDRMVSDDRFRLLSFTGSPSVGWKMKAEAGKKKVVLELGGNAGAIVDETADLDWAVERMVYGAFAYAGQVCISVQRIYVVRAIYDEFASRFVERVGRVKVGEPLDPATELEPMVDEKAVERTHGWVTDAIRDGARALVPASRTAAGIHRPCSSTSRGTPMICSEEAFAPVVNLFAVDTFADALRAINDSRFGLQCGVFTGSLDHALRAHDELEVGGVIVNDVPTWRTDAMPYGGVKDSGLGREGLRWSIEDMTEPRLLAFARTPRRRDRSPRPRATRASCAPTSCATASSSRSRSTAHRSSSSATPASSSRSRTTARTRTSRSRGRVRPARRGPRGAPGTAAVSVRNGSIDRPRLPTNGRWPITCVVVDHDDRPDDPDDVLQVVERIAECIAAARTSTRSYWPPSARQHPAMVTMRTSCSN